MGLFTTRQLLGYTEQKVKFNPLFLSLFFRRTVTFPTQEVMLDKITGKTPIAAYVSPVVGGKVLRNRGGETRVLRPGYVKPKHEVNYAQVVERLPGEDPARLNDPAYRRLRILTDNLKQEEKAIVQVEEMQAVSAVLNGKYTMQGEQFDTVEVDFGRSAGNNIIQATGKKWSEQDRETFDPTYDLDMYCDQASGLINIAVMDGKVWRLLNGFKLFREKLDTRRGSNSQLETAVKDLGAVVSFKGYYGDLAI
ncbi:major capsid protein, partial [Salmonella enterica]|nr:major capsid protein [Salmonella enterica]